jgi:hypothetical protein
MEADQVVWSAARYNTLSDHPHAYAEGLFVNDLTSNAMYNVDICARAFEDAQGNKKAYFVKLLNDADSNNKTMLRIGRIVNNVFTYTLEEELEDIDGCSDYTPLETEVGTTGRSEPVWLRIEVKDNHDQARAIVIGTVAWGCTSGVITNCATSCSIAFEDYSDPKGMYNKVGATGFDSHHKNQYIDRFRAGWENAP